MWLVGAEPNFDNVVFKSRVDMNDLQTNFDMVYNPDKVEKTLQESEMSYQSGNSTNLLFVDTCLSHIEQTGNNEQALLESAILGL